MKENILTYFHETVRKKRDKVAIVDFERKYTFFQLYTVAREIGKKIKSIYPYEKRPVVIIMKKRGMEIAAFLGSLYSGNFYVPIDTKLPVERLRYIIEELDNPLVIADSWYMCTELHEMSEYVWEFNSNFLDSILEEQTEKFTCPEIVDVDPLYIIYTSGSTGQPKGVVIPHRAIIDCIEEMTETMGISDNDIFFNLVYFHFDASVPDIYNMLFNGCTLHIVDERISTNPLKILKYISDNQVNTLVWVPSNLIFIANTPFLSRVDMSCIKKVFFCGEVLPAKYLNIWKRNVSNAKYVNYYGPTEATYACTYYVIDREFSDNELLPIGRPCRNTRVLILDDNKREVKKGDIGELYVQGACLALGYYKNTIKTQENFIQNPLNSNYEDKFYRTGDLVKYNEEGNIEYIGRKDFQIKFHGYRIELGDIENAICTIYGIKRACCVFNKEKELIIGVYESDKEIFDLYDKLSALLPEYMVPHHFVWSCKIPLTTNGKIDRKRVLHDTRDLL